MAVRGLLNRFLGDRGERAAVRYLKQHGYRIIARNARSRIGEIDIVALDRSTSPATIVFVEVKTRTSQRAGAPADAVDSRKQRQIARTALAWLKRRKLLDRRIRFDIVAVLLVEDRTRPEVTHYTSAYEPPDVGSMFG